mgnify:CR=1 FL=1
MKCVFFPLQFVMGIEKKNIGGREGNNVIPQGLTLKSLKHHYSLWPLFGALGFAVGLGVVFSLRMLTKATDVNWRKEDLPFNAYAKKQYRMLNPTGHDFSKTQVPLDLVNELSEAANKKK